MDSQIRLYRFTSVLSLTPAPGGEGFLDCARGGTSNEKVALRYGRPPFYNHWKIWGYLPTWNFSQELIPSPMPVPCAGKLKPTYFWLIALSFQGLLPTCRVKVQYSSNLTGSVLLPEITAPVVSSVV
jgi:hypothetical protein